MKIHHSLVLNKKTGEPIFREFNLPFKDEGIVIVLDLTEEDPLWPVALQATARYQAAMGSVLEPGRVWTEFTDDERMRAPWLEMVPAWHNGYPQPAARSPSSFPSTSRSALTSRICVGLATPARVKLLHFV